MPLLDPLTPPHSITVADSAILMALLDALVAKDVFDKHEIQNIVMAAMRLVAARWKSAEGSRAMDVLGTLWGRFSDLPISSSPYDRGALIQRDDRGREQHGAAGNKKDARPHI
jgi:hypothetical protein